MTIGLNSAAAFLFGMKIGIHLKCQHGIVQELIWILKRHIGVTIVSHNVIGPSSIQDYRDANILLLGLRKAL